MYSKTIMTMFYILLSGCGNLSRGFADLENDPSRSNISTSTSMNSESSGLSSQGTSGGVPSLSTKGNPISNAANAKTPEEFFYGKAGSRDKNIQTWLNQLIETLLENSVFDANARLCEGLFKGDVAGNKVTISLNSIDMGFSRGKFVTLTGTMKVIDQNGNPTGYPDTQLSAFCFGLPANRAELVMIRWYPEGSGSFLPQHFFGLVNGESNPPEVKGSFFGGGWKAGSPWSAVRTR